MDKQSSTHIEKEYHQATSSDGSLLEFYERHRSFFDVIPHQDAEMKELQLIMLIDIAIEASLHDHTNTILLDRTIRLFENDVHLRSDPQFESSYYNLCYCKGLSLLKQNKYYKLCRMFRIMRKKKLTYNDKNVDKVIVFCKHKVAEQIAKVAGISGAILLFIKYAIFLLNPEAGSNWLTFLGYLGGTFACILWCYKTAIQEKALSCWLMLSCKSKRYLVKLEDLST